MKFDRFILLCNVFFAGFVIMALEIVGIRILASFFGYSVFVWGSAIGIVLVSLSIGYWLGGIVADRSSRPTKIYKIIFISVIYLCLAILAYNYMLEYLSEWNFFTGLLIASLVLLVPPSFLLSMIPPIATKALLEKNKEGRTIGNIYALSNVGSILGTFATTFYLIPILGSRLTLTYSSAGMLLLVMLGFLTERVHAKRFFLIFFVSAMFLSVPIIFPEHKGPYTLLKTESVYNTIELREHAGTRWLLLNGYPMSYKEKEPKLGSTFYDAMACFPELIGAKDVLILGFAAGTVAGKMNAFFPGKKIVGVEIDPKVVKLAKEYFSLQESEKLRVYVDDARHFLINDKNSYDVIFNNTINARFIPFHLVTKEFFELAKSRLKSKGVIISYSFYAENKTLLRDSIARTMCEVFPSVYYLNFPVQKVSLVFGFSERISKEELLNMVESAKGKVKDESVIRLFNHFKNMQRFDCSKGTLITDDKNPIDSITLKQII